MQFLDRVKLPHCAMFIRMKCEEDEEYLMYMYPNIASSNIHARSLEQLKGVLHAAYGCAADVTSSPLAFLHLTPSTNNPLLISPSPSISSSLSSSSSASFSSVADQQQQQQQQPQFVLHDIPAAKDNHQNHHRSPSKHATLYSPRMFLTSRSRMASSASSGDNHQNASSAAAAPHSIKKSIERLREELRKKQQLVATYKLIHDDLMFILVLPHLHELFMANFMETLYGLLKFSFDSIDSVVCNPQAHPDLDALFQRFFDRVLLPSQHTLRFLDTFSSSVPSLQCPLALTQLIDNELNMLEANFHSKDLMKTPHICFILGTCLLHSGYLLSSHLTPKLTKKVVSFVQAMNHMQRKSDSPEVITVHEIFYMEKTNPFGLVKPSTDGVAVQKKRYLLVVLCQGNQILCNVLSPREHALNQQDPFYTNEMRLCLQRMHANNIFKLVDQYLARQNPPLADPMSFIVNTTSKTRSNKLSSSSSQTHPMMGRPIPHTLTIDQSSLEILSSATTGPYNVLFNYVIHAQAQGTLLFPTNLSHNLSRIEPVFIKYCGIIRQTLMLRRQMNTSSSSGMYNSGNNGAGGGGGGGSGSDHQDSAKMERMNHTSSMERPLLQQLMDETEPIVEYGVHVEDSESFSPHTIRYWVVGAMLPVTSSNCGDLTEIYVCYEDSIPQNIVELAYRLTTSIM